MILRKTALNRGKKPQPDDHDFEKAATVPLATGDGKKGEEA